MAGIAAAGAPVAAATSSGAIARRFVRSRANAASQIRAWSSAAGRPRRRSRAPDIRSLSPSFPAWRSLRATRELRDVTGEGLSADLERLAHGRIDVDEIDEVGEGRLELHCHR